MNYIILSQKSWNNQLVEKLQAKFPDDSFVQIASKDDFTAERLQQLKPDKVFIPHWSYIIPESIYANHECIVFHMTNLPFGRGGSPLQNLIARGITKTKISALRVEKGLDTGDIYMKRDLPLYGTAEEIFLRANDVIEGMIIEIIKDNPQPIPQSGEPIVFSRRKPEDSDISSLTDIDTIYDYIRMLDAEGYPHAFIENNGIRYEFGRVSKKADGSLVADVKIIKK